MVLKRGQVTLFIIIGVIILGIVAGYFLLRGSISSKTIPADIQPAYNSFLACLQQDTQTGIGILESRGGYIDLPAFEQGSTYMPFSSQLNFAGTQIPYWYYISGNNIQKEQVPSTSEMEQALGNFVDQRIQGCNLQDYYDQGFVFTMGSPKASVNIKDASVNVDLNMPLTIQKGNNTAVINTHTISQVSPFGKLYSSAKTVYDEEQNNMFLENYTLDELRLYAPVDGVEITCGPLIWDANTVFDNLQGAIVANTLALRSPGNGADYFSVKLPVTEQVRFLTSKDWPNSFEVTPTEGEIMTATPVGNQPGLGALGFCYVPYHFVYNVKYPVLVQLYDGSDIFQFPFAVVIEGNNPRQPLNATASQDVTPDICQYKNTEVQVTTYDRNLNPVNANISFECLGNTCNIGNTTSGELSAEFPQCGNGYIIAKAQGFKDTKYLFSTTQQGSLSMIMDRLYPINVQLNMDGRPYTGTALITFDSDYATQTLIYPNQRTLNLGEGNADIKAEIYTNSSITIGATTTQQCTTVPAGLLGIVGITKQSCFTINVPEQVISNALAGGGNISTYFTETQLSGSHTLVINAQSLPVPDSIDQIQNNYLLFDQNQLQVNLQ